MRYIYMLLFGFSCLCACKPTPEFSSGNITIIDSLQTHMDRNTFFNITTLVNSAGEDSVFQLFNYNEKYFLIYDMSSKGPVDSVNVKAYTKDRYSRAGLTASGAIYVLEASEKLLKKINPQTRQIDSFYYEDTACYSITAQNSSLTVLADSVIFLQVNPKGGIMSMEHRLAHFKSRSIAKFVMRDKKLIKLGTYCPFPESYAKGDFKDDEPVIYASRPNELWYAFSDASRFYHAHKGREEVIKTGYPFVPLEKIHPDSLRSITFVKQYQIRNMQVSGLAYLPTQQHVHLYCKPPAPVLDSNGELNGYFDCDNYLLDYDLKKSALRRYLIPQGLNYKNGAAFRDVLIWANDRDKNDELVLYTIKLQ